MRIPLTWLAVPALAVGFVAATAVTYFYVTIPPDVDPATIESRVIGTPAEAHLTAVEAGRAAARSLTAEEKLPGMSVAVAVDGRVVWAEGFRYADVERRTPVTPDMRFRIGGVTEALTAAAVGLLVERGALDLDAPVQRYVPRFPEKEWRITTRQLMAHTAGFRRSSGEPEHLPGVVCTDDVERFTFFADDELRYEPGTRRAHARFGWVVVGAVVGGAAGVPYAEFMEREVLAPLDMRRTVPGGLGYDEADDATPYFPRFMLDPRYGLQEAPEVNLACLLPAAGYLSTPSDLARFGAAMMSGALLTAATWETLQTPVPLASGDSDGQALGWVVQQAPLGAGGTPTRIVGIGLGEAVRDAPLSAVSTGGHVAGGTATLMLVPEHRLAIAVATNVSGSRNVAALAMRLGGAFVDAGARQ
ncbi:MAG: serine hydrolase domain-containing protein [Acidobacteriota bacterium]